MSVAAVSVASLSVLFTAVAATTAWQAARVGLGPAQPIALHLRGGDSSSALALSLTSVRSSDRRRARAPSPTHPSSRVRPAPASTPSSPSTEEPQASRSLHDLVVDHRPSRGRARSACHDAKGRRFEPFTGPGLARPSTRSRCLVPTACRTVAEARQGRRDRFHLSK